MVKKTLWFFVLIIIAVVAFLAWRWQASDDGGSGKENPSVSTIPLAHPENPRAISVMTANVALATPTATQYPWATRRAMVVKVLLKYHADIIGTQACSPVQTAYLSKYLTGYAHYPGHADMGSNVFATISGALEIWNQIFYQQDRFTLVAATYGLVRPHHLQVNPTENTYYSLVVLHDRLGVLPDVIVIDTHLRHGSYNATLCARKLHVILLHWKKKFPGDPTMLMGDMNHPKSDIPVYTALRSLKSKRFFDTFNYNARPKGVLWGTWNQFTGKPVIALPSDLIFVSRQWKFTPAQILRDHTSAGLYPSDHYFVITTLIWPQP